MQPHDRHGCLVGVPVESGRPARVGEVGQDAGDRRDLVASCVTLRQGLAFVQMGVLVERHEFADILRVDVRIKETPPGRADVRGPGGCTELADVAEGVVAAVGELRYCGSHNVTKRLDARWMPQDRYQSVLSRNSQARGTGGCEWFAKAGVS